MAVRRGRPDPLCSHTFILLKARGVNSVTERTATIVRIRHLARQVAEAWLAECRSLFFPLLSAEKRAAWLTDHPQDALLAVAKA